MTDPRADRPLHGLRWAVKTSFTDYVRRMPDGQVWVGDGAFPLGEHDVFFKLDPTASCDGVWSCTGDVRFSGHAGLLFVRIARPSVVVDDGRAEVTVRGPDDEPTTLVTTPLDLVETQDATQLWLGSDVRLTASGVPVFNEVYAEGERFEPLVLQLPAPSARG